jgi:hypothetical protein
MDEIYRNSRERIQLPPEQQGNFSFWRFPLDDGPRPIYLGEAHNKSVFRVLKSAIPHRPQEITSRGNLSAKHMSAFILRAEIDQAEAEQKRIAAKERRKKKSSRKMKADSNVIKRVQRYLGIRTPSTCQRREHGQQRSDHTMPVSHVSHADRAVVFVCVDVEAWEHDTSKVTEIGIASLDTAEIYATAAGERGQNWRSAIHARHFRIRELKHLRNSRFVGGNPDAFAFGTSEFVRVREASRAVAACFRPPFCDVSGATATAADKKRTVVLVGHSLGGDVAWLRQIGLDVKQLDNLIEGVDTARMHRAYRRRFNGMSLGGMLEDMNISPENLHNAGNDAVYTLQGTLAIAVQEMDERRSGALQTRRQQEKEAVAAVQAAREAEAEATAEAAKAAEPSTTAETGTGPRTGLPFLCWSSGSEDDGGPAESLQLLPAVWHGSLRR